MTVLKTQCSSLVLRSISVKSASENGRKKGLLSLDIVYFGPVLVLVPEMVQTSDERDCC